MTGTAPAPTTAPAAPTAEPRTLAEAADLTRSPEFAGNTGGGFGAFGGADLPPPLVGPMAEVAAAYQEARHDPEFYAEYTRLLRDVVGRPSPITAADRLSDGLGGARIHLKREDLNHTGAHKINHTIGEALLAKRMGKRTLIAETGAGQHGVATATAAALFGLDCTIYMGAEDTERQALNVARMRLLGADVIAVEQGSRTLKDAINEAFRDWVANVETTHYLLGTVAGPHPFPAMVRDFHRIIGEEARAQTLERVGRLPDAVVACVGGGSNAMGIFHAFLDDTDPLVRLVGCEAGGDGVSTGRHSATITGGTPGVLHGARSFVMQDEDGQTIPSHSVSAGLDYPSVGPEHAWLADIGRAEYRAIDDGPAMEAFALLSMTEGIMPAIESSHALAGALELGRELGRDAVILVSLSGRGDKDVDTASRWFGLVGDEPARTDLDALRAAARAATPELPEETR